MKEWRARRSRRAKHPWRSAAGSIVAEKVAIDFPGACSARRVGRHGRHQARSPDHATWVQKIGTRDWRVLRETIDARVDLRRPNRASNCSRESPKPVESLARFVPMMRGFEGSTISPHTLPALAIAPATIRSTDDHIACSGEDPDCELIVTTDSPQHHRAVPDRCRKRISRFM